MLNKRKVFIKAWKKFRALIAAGKEVGS
jgi:hypothetical protein